jgi:hypothetical protein
MSIQASGTHDDLFSCLVAAVNLAKSQQIQKVSVLRSKLIDRGFSENLIDEALKQFGSALQEQNN